MNAFRLARFALVAALPVVVTSLCPAQSRVKDEPLKVIQTTDPQYPLNSETSLLRGGEVSLVLNVDADGRLVDWLVTSYSHPEFAEAAVGAIKEWQYKPARQRGEPVGTRSALVFNFEVKGQVFSLNAIEAFTTHLNSTVGVRRIERVCLPQELDHPVQAVQTVSPRGVGPRDSVESKTIVIDFYIDESGRPRMPVVLDVPDQFAAAAVDALMQWRYTAPTKQGTPMAVRARQTFVFKKNS